MLINDIAKYIEQVNEALPWAVHLDKPRYYVLVNMAFNMGINGLLSFKNTLTFIEKGQYESAAENMKLSRWYNQVGIRARELCEQMKTGQWVVYWENRGLKDGFENVE